MAPSRAAATATPLLAALLLLLLAQAAHHAAAKKLLRCACDSRYCAASSCATDGVCFASLKRATPTGPVDAALRCVDAAYLIPPERPFVCEYNRRQNHTYVSGCCGKAEGDLCNQRMNLTLSLHWPEEGQRFRGPFEKGRKSREGREKAGTGRGEEKGGDEWTWERTVVVVVLGGGSAVTAVLLASLLFRRRRHYHKRQHQGQHRHHHHPPHPQTPPCADCCGLLTYNEVESCETGSTDPNRARAVADVPTDALGGLVSGRVSRGPGSSSGYGSGRGVSVGRCNLVRPPPPPPLAPPGGLVGPSSSSGENISSSLQVSQA